MDIYGWRGLIPDINIKEYKRKSQIKVDNFGYGASVLWVISLIVIQI
jgi:hypothetical protein